MVKAAEDLMAKCKKEAEQSEGQLEKMQQVYISKFCDSFVFLIEL